MNRAIVSDSWAEFAANGGDELVALGEDAVLNLEDFLAELALPALGFGDFALQAGLLDQVGGLACFVAQFADAFLDVLKRLFGSGN